MTLISFSSSSLPRNHLLAYSLGRVAADTLGDGRFLSDAAVTIGRATRVTCALRALFKRMWVLLRFVVVIASQF